MVTRILCLVGRSNTGKTTLIERLIPLLAAKGITVATIKHHEHPFEIDYEGKDTYRHKKAGAKTAMIVSSQRLAMVKDLDENLTIEEIAARYAGDVDLVIVEGYKAAALPKIEVYNVREDLPPVAAKDKDLVALVTDAPIPASVPLFSRDDIESVASFIIRRFGLQK
ncbi:MAG TPA: molybdopterin-guanine dinucleotide biosynthesis protein B [Syntrophorhabdales bacterium]|nr:molybdopterin-guanine dinucleotide biosynthesis protein B [Syntrophorhabdales bacterium]